MLKKFVAAAASIALVATPVLAAGGHAASSDVAPASETISGDNQQIYGASLLLQAGILLALILGGYFIYEAIDNPSSP
ncbi:hypothetical protein [Sphingomonas sp.]|jgi:hypothetical protein|uniref:hypothetical protein n=1 Tax=Sphingomonas sp. TaxID=28214 RepID=UPI002FC65A42